MVQFEIDAWGPGSFLHFKSSIRCKIYIERELAYGAIRNTNDMYAMDHFSVFKVQMIDPTSKNILHIKI
jgi:hypothetical protein